MVPEAVVVGDALDETVPGAATWLALGVAPAGAGTVVLEAVVLFAAPTDPMFGVPAPATTGGAISLYGGGASSP
ncbi:hypothetical protein GCM10009539_33460 [Cryptosporangium japonicum]|uniref:Uncharacterized protein n=1 Tax=Cryptosporangium japonicum TaxID=80872 RepID=A0ABN0UC15_9ACTN